MKSGHTIQLLLSWMITWISAKFQALGMLLLCLLFLMFIDYITGMLASRKEGIDHPDDVSYGWRSQKGFWGIIKKTGCWMVIASAFSVDELLLHSAKSLGITYPGNLYLGVFVTVSVLSADAGNVAGKPPKSGTSGYAQGGAESTV